eukprot:2346862-Pleurochrysis_carterae.AAC.1
MVTGGSGLVGKGIQANLERDPPQNERWVFLTSKDGDLRSGSALLSKHNVFRCGLEMSPGMTTEQPHAQDQSNAAACHHSPSLCSCHFLVCWPGASSIRSLACLLPP